MGSDRCGCGMKPLSLTVTPPFRSPFLPPFLAFTKKQSQLIHARFSCIDN